MSNSKLVSLWLLFFLTVFTIGYVTTTIVYTAVMADFVEPNTDCINMPGLIVENPSVENCTLGLIEVEEQLEVKPVPNNAVQTDQYTPIQPSVNPIGKEL